MKGVLRMEIDLNESFKPIQRKGYINNRIYNLNNNYGQNEYAQKKEISFNSNNKRKQ